MSSGGITQIGPQLLIATTLFIGIIPAYQLSQYLEHPLLLLAYISGGIGIFGATLEAGVVPASIRLLLTQGIGVMVTGLLLLLITVLGRTRIRDLEQTVKTRGKVILK